MKILHLLVWAHTREHRRDLWISAVGNWPLCKSSGRRLEGIRCLSTSVLMKEKTGRAAASSGNKATDVVTLGCTCCYFLSIHELLCHSFKSVLCCLNLNAVMGIFKVMLILPFYCFFHNGLFKKNIYFLEYCNFVHSGWMGSVKCGNSWCVCSSMALMRRYSTGKRLFKINKEQFLSIFIFREVHPLKFPGTHWAFTKYLNRLRGHSDPSVDTVEFSGSWHLHGKTGMSAEESSINILTGACYNGIFRQSSRASQGSYFLPQ